MPTPSLLIVPARFKTGKLYSQIPTSGAGDFTVTRNTEARRFDSAGLVASVASGIPRLDYYTSGGVTGCPALLVEPAATNLCLQSENFGTTWSITRINAFGSGSVLNTTATLDPFGTNLADYIQEDTSPNDTHRANQLIAITSGTTYTYTCFIKSAERFQSALYVFHGGVERYGVFNTNAGTATATNATVSMDNFGNGWYRCRMTFTATTSVTQEFRVSICDDSGNLGYTGTGTKGIYVIGAQLETGSVATSYIPTTTGTGSRSADTISVTGAVSGSIGQTEGTIYLEVDAANASSQFFRINAGVTNAIHIFKNSSSQYAVNIYASGSVISLSDTSSKSGFVKIAIAYKSGETALVINGGTPITSASSYSFSAALSSVNFLGGVEAVLPARIRAVALYTTRLTNAELATLTTP